MPRKLVTLLSLVTIAFLAAGRLPSTAGAQPSADGAKKEIEPPEVYVNVGLVLKELELLRFEMGRPKNIQVKIGVEGAAPREVYFQALTMFRKADRLCFEHTRDRDEPPKRPKGEIRPRHVFEMVSAARERIHRVSTKLRIDMDSVKPDPVDDSILPNDVFQSIVQANRQLNLMLDQRFSPSDVFQQVTSGVNYASDLLSEFPNEEPIPPTPKYMSGKVPADVYRRLLQCQKKLRDISVRSGLAALEVTLDENAIERVEPSDVYDIASLVVSELAYLHDHLDDPPVPRRVYYPGRKFPAHVFQRAGILEAQVEKLEELTKANPDWLNVQATGDAE